MGGGVEQSLSQNNKPFVIPRSEASSGSEPFAQLINNLTTKEKYSYCVSSGVSGLCPDGIRLELFKRSNENLLCRSEQKFSLLSFKSSFNSACFSFLWFVSFLLLAQLKRKEMNIKNICFMFHPFFGKNSVEN